MTIILGKNQFIAGALAVLFASTVQAATVSSKVYATDGTTIFGEVVFEDSDLGLLIKPQLSGLPAGHLHGFHIHEHPECGDHGMSAGGHFDPEKTNSHQGPYGKGHLGDLPVLAVDNKGVANTPLLAPRLKTSDIQGHSLMIHADGDNYSDSPPLGGGGARIGCGKISS